MASLIASSRRYVAERLFALLGYRPGRDEMMFGALVALALGLRLWDLDGRPLHYDESLHAYYSWDLFTGNGVRHEPWIHGPLQFFLNAAVFSIFWDDDYTVRLVYALFGAALVGLPYFLRNYMGRPATLIASTMLALSPALLYFSRYSRNDILMAFWALALFVLVWRYLHEQKNRYLYMMAAVLGFAFATKETVYILVVIFGAVLTILAVTQLVPLGLRRIRVSDLTGPAALLLMLATLTLPQFAALTSIFQSSGEQGLVLAYSGSAPGNPVGLPLWGEPFVTPAVVDLPVVIDALVLGGIAVAALWGITVFRDRPRRIVRTLTAAALGALAYAVLTMLDVEVSRNYLAAGGILIGVTVLSAAVGIMWRWKVWLISAGIFYLIWTTLYTSFFGVLVRPYSECPDTLGGVAGTVCTRLGGAFTGVWQGLGYWLAQQEVARGNQPWYYYVTLGSLYEFLPLVIGAVGIVYYLKKGGFLGLFLVLWAVLTFVIYTIASEKMPWLLVNVTLPFILLSAKLLGDLLQELPWRRLAAGGHLALLVAAPLLLLTGVFLFQSYLREGRVTSLDGWVAAAAMIVVAAVVAALMYRAKPRMGFRLATLGVAALLLGFSTFTGVRASYTDGDGRPEMLVYAGGSEDVRTLANELREEFLTRDPAERAHVDYEVWYPLNWYVRNDDYIEYRCYKDEDEGGYVDWCETIQEKPTATALLLLDSHGQRDSQHLMAYIREGPYKDLLWFPEIYRRPNENRQKEGIWEEIRKDFGFVQDNIGRRETWHDVVDYFLHRRIGKVWWDSKFYSYMPGGFQIK